MTDRASPLFVKVILVITLLTAGLVVSAGPAHGNTLTIKYAVTGWTSVGCQLTFEAQSGKQYTIHGKKLDFDNATGFAAIKQPQIITVVVWVTDADDGDVVVDETAYSPVSS